MEQENKARIIVHKKMYEDLVLWINNQFEGEIKSLLPSAKISVCEWYSRELKDLIEGAAVHIEIKGWFDSETINYLCHVLGAKEYRVTAYPLRRMHISFKVSIMNTTKSLMQCAGKWTPKWKKEDEHKKEK